MKTYTRAELARLVDYMLTNPQARAEDVARVCGEAREHGFHGVCVLGSRVEQAYAALEDSDIKVTALAGFPFGAMDSDVKRYEVEVAVDQGAHEIEMVINIGRVKDGDSAYVLRELRDIAEAAEERPVKVIVESLLLTAEERRAVCAVALDSGVQFVSTGSGLGRDATPDEVRELRELVGKKFGVKANGRFSHLGTALALLEAGATRLGTTEAVALLETLPLTKVDS